MEKINYKKFYPTAVALYFTYFIHGIGASILGQYCINVGCKSIRRWNF